MSDHSIRRPPLAPTEALPEADQAATPELLEAGRQSAIGRLRSGPIRRKAEGSVQGEKSRIYRKADEDGEKKDEQLEVSDPAEPAEKEADEKAEEVAGDLHGDEKGEKKDSEKGGEKDAKDGEKGGEKDGEKDAEEKPAPIAAKLNSVALKIMRDDDGKKDEKKDAKLETDSKVDAKAEAPPPSAAADDPGAWAAYQANWPALMQRLEEMGIDPAQKQAVEAKKGQWFEDAYRACETEDQAGVNAVVDRIYNEMPKERRNDRHFWSGGQGAMDQAAAATEGNANAVMLESSHVGGLFNGVFNSPPSKLDWRRQAILFWRRASTQYARAATGHITSHLNIDFQYATDQKVNRGACFGAFELPELLENMRRRAPDGERVVTGITINMHIHGRTANRGGSDVDVDTNKSLNFPGDDGLSENGVFDAVDAGIQQAVNAVGTP